ncbi:MAG: diaminopimelate epimerase [Burkholderiales bacterium]|nr:diaminopimelate epimerase [Burkholderiales bacterium]
MRIDFTKMHGLGNDFIVIDATRRPLDLTAAQWRRLADRHFGVGADQILIVAAPTRADTDFRYRIINADGGEVEQCGNGARCFVRFVHDKGLSAKRSIRVETRGGIIEPRLEDDGAVTVDMGAPAFDPAALPFDPARARPGDGPHRHLLALDGGGEVEVAIVSMGNPHAVCTVADVDSAPVARDGPRIEAHPAFPARVNAGFMQVCARDRIRLRVYERGAGETLACGTGACAAVVAGIVGGRLEAGAPVRVDTRGGSLSIAWHGPGRPVLMTGPAVTVFEGAIELPLP